MNYLIDTNILIDFARKKPYSISLMKRLAVEGDLGISVVTYAEMLAGCAVEKRGKLMEMLDKFTIYSVTQEISKYTGRYIFDFARKGKTLHFQDTTIASTAIVNNLTLVTQNTKDFPMEELCLFDISSN